MPLKTCLGCSQSCPEDFYSCLFTEAGSAFLPPALNQQFAPLPGRDELQFFNRRNNIHESLLVKERI